MDDQLTKKQKRELKRMEKERMKQESIRKAKLLKIRNWFLAFFILGFSLFLIIKIALPQGEDFSILLPDQGRSHIRPGDPYPKL